MNDSTVATDVLQEALLGEVAGEFSQRLAEGEDPSIEEYAGKYPQLADAIREIFPALNLLRDSHVAEGAVGQTAESPRSLGEFRILREIGRGGMGVVYEAEQLSLKRRVALKVLPFASILKEEQLTRFKNEALAAASLDHEHIVHAYSVGCEQGVHYFAMQYVEGQNLAEVIEQLRRLQRGTLDTAGIEQPHPDSVDADGTLDSGAAEGAKPSANGSVKRHQEGISTDPLALGSTSGQPLAREYFQRIATLGAQAAEALDYAHQRGVVHRDIKPSNLMLDAQQRVYITDFGLAFVEGDRDLTITGDILGTLRYMSPEQAAGDRRRIDHRTDVYSLGATLYELAAMRPAFTGNDRMDLLRQIADEQPPSLRRHNRRIPADLETIIDKAMSKEPTDRYTSAAELAADLRRFAADEPIQVVRPSLTRRASRWARRRAGSLLAALAVTLLLTIGSSVATAIVWHERNQTEVARAAAETSADAAREAEGRERNERLKAKKLEKEEREQRQKAEQAEAEATAARDQTMATHQYLINAFRSPDPERDGHTITVAEVLSQAVREIRATSKLVPLQRAALLNAIGLTYTKLGLNISAISVLEEALDLRRTHLGRHHRGTLDSMNSLALAYLNAGRHKDSMELRQQILKRYRETLGPDDPELLAAIHNLAGCHLYAGEFAKAMELIEEALDRRMEVLGPEHPSTLDSMNARAEALRLTGRYAEAIKLYEEALELNRQILGTAHPSTLNSMNNLALEYSSSGRTADAIKLLKETLELNRKILGTDHPLTLNSIQSLAVALWRAKDEDKSIRLKEAAGRLVKLYEDLEKPDGVAKWRATLVNLENQGDEALSEAADEPPSEGVVQGGSTSP